METLAELILRERSKRWPSRRDADRATGISYATWQNVEVRDTIPTLITLTRIAKALEIPEAEVRKAALVSQDAREREQLLASDAAADASQAAQKRASNDKPPAKRSPRRPAK